MIKISDILDFLNKSELDFVFVGDRGIDINNYTSIDEILSHTVTWLRSYNCELIDKINKVNDILLITSYEAGHQIKDVNVLMVDKPKMIFFEIVKQFFVEKTIFGISSLSDIRTKEIGKNVTIGNFCTISNNVRIGDNVSIGHGVQIICPTIIGNGCNISSGVIIGSNGFGYYEDKEGKNSLVPHSGGVIIGDHVDIGANTCIDRGTIGNTIIDEYTKIDNLCHIAHNVKIGKNVFVIAQSMIGGSAILEENAYIAPGAIVMNQLEIGVNSLVGLGAVVTKNVRGNMVVAGVPAKEIREREDSDKE